jgi:hypothetical protein
MVVCKYGCGTEFPDTPEGQAAYMRHCNFECPNNPKSKSSADSVQSTGKSILEGTGEIDDNLDDAEILNKIIAEVTKTVKRPSIVRMVRRHLGNKEESIKMLAEALRLADIPPNQRSLILKNWATHLEVPDIEEIIKTDEKEEKKKTSEEKEKEEKEIKTATEEILEKTLKDELRQLELLRLQKQRKLLERELSEPDKDGSAEKVDFVVDGVHLKVTPQEMLAWKKYLKEEKEWEDEREARRNRADEKIKRSDDELVEWVVGEGSNTRTIKIRPETLPLLIQSQSKKGGDSDEMKVLREELKDQRNMFQQFQTAVLQKEIDEMKIQLSINPIDRMMQDKQKLEALGIVRSDRMSAQDQMYAMDRKKLDTLLNIVIDKSQSTGDKVDKIIDLFGPFAKQMVQDQIVQMKKQRGEGLGDEVQRTETETKETLEKLEEVDKALTNKPAVSSSGTKPSNEPKVIDIGKTQKPQETIEGENK